MTNMYLIHKVNLNIRQVLNISLYFRRHVMILEISGVCRRNELYNMTIQDIEDQATCIIVKNGQRKTSIQRTGNMKISII